jgi:hypothetical protein
MMLSFSNREGNFRIWTISITQFALYSKRASEARISTLEVLGALANMQHDIMIKSENGEW